MFLLRQKFLFIAHYECLNPLIHNVSLLSSGLLDTEGVFSTFKKNKIKFEINCNIIILKSIVILILFQLNLSN
jgi:hypothetical protein